VPLSTSLQTRILILIAGCFLPGFIVFTIVILVGRSEELREAHAEAQRLATDTVSTKREGRIPFRRTASFIARARRGRGARDDLGLEPSAAAFRSACGKKIRFECIQGFTPW